MNAPSSDSDPLPDGDDLDGLDDTDLSGEAASDPEAARQEAEDALAEVEALADLDEAPDAEGDSESSGEEPGTTSGATPAGEAGEGAADAAAGGSTSEAGKRPEDQCENCGALLHGPYCSQCGQQAADRIVPIWHMINEALEAVVELDLRVLYTLPKFLFRPGRLTKEYINGRRKRYIRPFRLYLFATFVLFAAIALTTTGNVGFVLDPQGMARFNPPNTAITLGGGADTTATAPDDTTSAARSVLTTEGSMFGDPDERERLARTIESDSTFVNIELYNDPEANKRLELLLRGKIAQAVRNPWDFLRSAIDWGPYLMFLMLPIFGLLLKLLYVRRGRFYVEHLIFSLHVHAFAFFAFTVGILMEQSDTGWLNTMATWVEVSPFLYLLVAMIHVYEQGVIKSSIKAFILLSIYSIILAIGFLLLLFVALLLL